jgi:spermidine synthase
MAETGELAVFGSGMVGLGLQILAGRLLAPSFGSSAYTWGSIIGIFMVTLSLGYYVGGKYSAKATKKDVVIILFIASLCILFLSYYGQTLALMFGSLPLPSQYAALPAVLLLFGPPSFLFGVLTPIAVSLSSQHLKGEASGKIFTLDTVGSIFGSFGATFLLIPLLSLTFSFVVLGWIALLMAVFISPKKINILVAIVIAVALFFAAGTSAFSGNDELPVMKESVYQRLQVAQEGDIRTLYSDSTPQSSIDLSDPQRLVYRYTQYGVLPFLLTDVESALFIGGGGFTLPKYYVSEGVAVDVVELDPVVYEFAQEYFYVDPETMDVTIGDGREYLTRTEKTYDLIFVDAYKRDRVPFHLTTQEFFELVEERLNPEGVVMVNIINTPGGESSKFFRSELKTLQSVFDTTYAFPMYRTNQLQNIELIGTNNPRLNYEELLQKAEAQNADLTLLNTLILEVPLDDVAILYDDRAPVDTLLTSIADLPLDLEEVASE